MEVVKTALLGLPVLKVIGEVDHLTATALENSVQATLRGNGAHILLDLTDCPYLDSGGLSVLLHAVRRVEGDGWLGVVAPNRNLQRLFEITGLLSDPRFRLFASSQEAAAAAES